MNSQQCRILRLIISYFLLQVRRDRRSLTKLQKRENNWRYDSNTEPRTPNALDISADTKQSLQAEHHKPTARQTSG
jgi:hypothetical protein